MQVLFEIILRGWSYKIEIAFDRKSGNVSQCTKCPLNIQNYV
jgi:hypothetical protein